MDYKGSKQEIVLKSELKEIISELPRNYLKLLWCRYPDVDKECLSEILKDTLVETKTKIEQTEIYDFCIIMSDADFEIAHEIKGLLQASLKLKGCMLDDIIEPGKDILQCYELMMERSCKIFFLLTQNFTDCKFCSRIQNSAIFKNLMDKATHSQEKCVPIILESLKRTTSIPLALNGIAGIIYNDATKNMGVCKKYFGAVHADRSTIRKKIFETMFAIEVKSKVNEYLKEEEETQLAIQESERRMLAIQDSERQMLSIQDSERRMLTLDNSSQVNEAASVAIAAVSDDSSINAIQQAFKMISTEQNKCIEMSQRKGLVDSLAGVCVSGTQHHIGTNITNHITVVINGEKQDDDDDDSD